MRDSAGGWDGEVGRNREAGTYGRVEKERARGKGVRRSGNSQGLLVLAGDNLLSG